MVDFDPSIGSEVRKVRPALVISNDTANRHNSKVTLVPLTSTVRENPLVVVIAPQPSNGLDRSSLIKIPDVTTFNKARLRRRLGQVSATEMVQVEERLRLHLAL